MTFYNRKGMLYARINGKRVSTKLKDTKANRKLFESYSKNDEFFEKFNVNKKLVPMVIELCEEILEKLERVLKPTSMKAYRSLFNSRIIPYFDKDLVSEIEPLTIYEFYETFNDYSTLNTCNSLLKKVFEFAIIKKYITTTPLIISRPKFENFPEPDPFTLDEIKLMLRSKDDWLINIIGILVFTGMRIGELSALSWEEVDFKLKSIEINRTLTLGYTHSPKTKTSKRIIDLPIESLPFFKKQRLRTGLKEFIAYTPRGKTFDCSTTYNYYFKELLGVLKIKERPIYQLRHTFASLKLSMGEKLEWVSWMMGHKNTAITQQKYFKYIPSVDRERVVISLNDAQNQHTS
jgi:integrase